MHNNIPLGPSSLAYQIGDVVATERVIVLMNFHKFIPSYKRAVEHSLITVCDDAA